MGQRDKIITSHEHLMKAISNESQKFQEFYLWLEKNMPPSFFEEVDTENLMLIAHTLINFQMQEYFTDMNLKRRAIVICRDSSDADLQILKLYSSYGIKNYRAYVSQTPPPVPGIGKSNIRIALIYFTEVKETTHKPVSDEKKKELRALVKKRNPEVTDEEFTKLISSMNTRFLHSLSTDRLILALDMFFRAKTRDHLQYEVRYNEDWQKSKIPSMQIMLAWKHTPKYNFLYRLARMINRHGLNMQKVNATYIDPYGKQPILMMALGLQGIKGKAAWDEADIPDFLKELAIMKYFGDFDLIDEVFVSSKLIRGNMAPLLRSMVYFVHQILVNVDVNLYTAENIREALCRHPELTVQLCEAFEYKFNPGKVDLKKYEKIKREFLAHVNELDTGAEVNDTRRKNVLTQGMNFIDYTLKTNFYRNNKTALSFRINPEYLNHVPFDRKAKFPELPYAIFFVKGMHFFAYHIRFKDIARGGLRTVIPLRQEQMVAERNQVFAECYNLAYTQHKKNKDIPEGGAKAIIFLKPYTRLNSEADIYRKEMEIEGIDPKEIDTRIGKFMDEQKLEYLYQTQRAFVSSLLTLINTGDNGKLIDKDVIDYYNKPENIYLGPDENMHNNIIEWIAEYSKKYHYKPGGAFISSKPSAGINHKEFGVTSLGVNVYMHEVLKYMGVDPKKEPFTVKMSGGPDGDVAGNQIVNLHKYYKKTAKLIALTDGSGTINDPNGLDLDVLVDLFKQEKPIKFYPPKLLSEGGFLLDRNAKKDETAYTQLTLCWRKKKGKVVEDWLSGNEMNKLFNNNVHSTYADVFIPAGGRPRTLNEDNISQYLDKEGQPTSKAIIEGANLYLTPGARRVLEEKGVIVIKDSSANKAGVICSSFEILSGLTLGDERFVENKKSLVKEILARLEETALREAALMLKTHKEKGEFLTDISEKISKRINTFTDQLLDYLEGVKLGSTDKDPLIKVFLSYCLPTLREKYKKELLANVPEAHKKAVIASHIACKMVYKNGLDWFPTIVDILPIILDEKF